MSEENIGAEKYDYELTLPTEKGDELQKLSVVQSLPSLINKDPTSTLIKILPKIQQELLHSSSEFHIQTSQVFQILISNHIFASESNIVPTLLQSLDSKDPVIANAWLETLLQVLHQLPLKAVQQEILPLAAHKGQCSQTISSRVACCRILGKISNHPFIKPIEIKKDVLPVVHGLSQDINYTVRGAICEQIPNICQGLGCSLSKNHLLPNLVELSQDDNSNVRAVAVSSVINCLPYLDKDTKTVTMAPLIMQLCTVTMKEDNFSSLGLAKDIGLLMSCMNGCLSQLDCTRLIGYFVDLARRGLEIRKLTYNTDTTQDVMCRQYCASNIAAVYTFLYSNAESEVIKLYDVFKSLASDSCYLVRQTVAEVFHEVAKILGKSNTILKPDFVRLLRDEAEEVLMNLVPNISKIFELFVSSGLLAIDRITPVSQEISKALIKCLSQLKKGYNWRLLAIFLKQLEYLPKCFRADQIHNDFTPLIVQFAVKGGTRPVRTQAARTLLVFLRYNTKQVQRTWLKEHLISELAESHNCYTRHIFIQLCINAIEIFSHKYFKENFFYALLALSEDSVSTVRYSMVSLLPTLRRMIRLPADRRLLQALEQVIVKLEKNEKDRDVLTNLIKRSKEMMSQSVRVGQDDIEANQKRLLEEEDMIAKGKLAFIPRRAESLQLSKALLKKEMSSMATEKTHRNKTSAKTINRSASANRQTTAARANLSAAVANRSTSVPRSIRPARTFSSTSREIISDMTFLKQHFITDAGIPLPIKDIVPNQNDDISVLKGKVSILNNDNEEKIEVETTVSALNITDDVKVNLRNMSKKNDKIKCNSQSEIPVSRNKRYSSIHSESEICPKVIVDKRRSLVLNPKDISKIPIVLKNDNLDGKKEDKSVKKSSSLPVPTRRKKQESKGT